MNNDNFKILYLNKCFYLLEKDNVFVVKCCFLK